MRSRRLCIVTHTYLPHIGGIERVVYEQSKRLRGKGFEPIVVTSRMNTDRNYAVDGIKVRCYDSLNLGFGLGIPYSIPNIGSARTFLEVINNSDIVHVHGHPYLSSLAASVIAKKYHKPLVLTQHNTFIKYENGIWELTEHLNDSIVGKLVLNASDKIITVSTATKNYVLSLGADKRKISVLHNGVDVNRFKHEPEIREETRSRLRIRADAKIVLSVRRLVYKNGIDTLIESAKLAIQRNAKIDFLIVGTGPDLNATRSMIDRLGISDRCKLAGFVSDADLPAYYNAADLFVLPSKSGEGLPLVLLEAMSCGLPVIATDVGGISEVMPIGCGRLVPPDAPDALAEAVLEFSEKGPLELKKELRKIAIEEFSWDKNVERLAELYEALI